MTRRIYLAAVRLLAEAPEPGDIPAERFFVHSGIVPEIWVESEYAAEVIVGRAMTFSFTEPLNLGFNRIAGTIERVIDKQTRERA